MFSPEPNNSQTESLPQQEEYTLLIKKEAIWAFLSLIVYKIVLDISYYFVISPLFSYNRFELCLNTMKLVESWFLFFAVFGLMPKSATKLSDIMLWLLILLSYIPMLTLFAFKDESRIFMYAVTIFWMAIFLLRHIMPKISLLPLIHDFAIRFLGISFLSLIVFFMIYKYLGFSFTLDLTKVYDIRSQYTETRIPFAGYLFNWQAYIINPVIFAIFTARKRWIYAAIIVIFQLLLFSNTGNKTFLFALFFVLILMWVITRKNPLIYMASGLTAIVLLSMLSYWLINDVWMPSLFTRRLLLVPAQLSFFYYDFFSEHDYVFLSHSIFRFFLDYPYQLNPSHLIGMVYFNSPQTGANTGVVGDAYMNLGFIGLILWSMLLVMVLKLVDACSKGKDMKIAVAAIAMPTIALTNSALLTNLLTHGLLVALIVLYLFIPEETRTRA